MQGVVSISKVLLWLVGRQGLSCLALAVFMVEMLLSMEEFIDLVLLLVLISLCVGELGVYMEKDVLVSMYVWLAVNLSCWSFVLALQARYQSIVCQVVVVEVDGLEMGK